MKINVNWEKLKRKKKTIFVCTLALLCGTCIVNYKLNTEKSLKTSSEYVNYEEEMMQTHEGDVLVDSLNLTEVQGNALNSQEGSETEKGTGNPESKDGSVGEENALETSSQGVSNGMEDTGTLLVASDDYAELANADLYFAEARATLQQNRNEILSMLTEVIEESPDGPDKENATGQKVKIIDYMNKESIIENLLRNKGFADAIVIITDQSVNVTINQRDLSEEETARILDIVMRETGRPADQVVIQTKG